ncbi:hypothetical protein SAY86_012676 [Trapa natans]|uniref:Uncharacterized protein n=1 Tax=Trapa natans TaxID=22666 RepID=A0AAN7LY30_TRANT|nr:hypothetical protein SAY86_012676 [Trapa natans]
MEEVDETEAVPQVYMASILQGDRIGVSYYDASIHQLNVMELWEDRTSDFPMIDLVKYQAQPIVIYTSTKSEESFIAALQRSGADGASEIPVKLVKSSLFSYEQAWHRYGNKEDAYIHLSYRLLSFGWDTPDVLCAFLSLSKSQSFYWKILLRSLWHFMSS